MSKVNFFTVLRFQKSQKIVRHVFIIVSNIYNRTLRLNKNKNSFQRNSKLKFRLGHHRSIVSMKS